MRHGTLSAAMAAMVASGYTPSTDMYANDPTPTTQGSRRNRGSVARDKRAAKKRANIRKHGG